MARRGLQWPVGAVAVAAMILGAQGFRLESFRIWRYDAGMRRIALEMKSSSASAPVLVAAPWINAPALQFYGAMFSHQGQTNWLRPVRSPEYADFWIVHPSDSPAPEASAWRLRSHDDESGANLYEHKR
jgi:hypothetical protein